MKLADSDPYDRILERKAEDAKQGETIWTIPANRAPRWFPLAIAASLAVAVMALIRPQR